jgi:hypothetical protein
VKILPPQEDGVHPLTKFLTLWKIGVGLPWEAEDGQVEIGDAGGREEGLDREWDISLLWEAERFPADKEGPEDIQNMGPPPRTLKDRVKGSPVLVLGQRDPIQDRIRQPTMAIKVGMVSLRSGW